MTDMERNIYDQVNLAYSKQRDEAENRFDIDKLFELHKEGDRIKNSPELLNAWQRDMMNDRDDLDIQLDGYRKEDDQSKVRVDYFSDMQDQ